MTVKSGEKVATLGIVERAADEEAITPIEDTADADEGNDVEQLPTEE